MKFDILTLFPSVFDGFINWSMIKKAREVGAAEIKIHNLRDWAIDKHGTVDDHPYGGGAGMVLMVEPIYHALKTLGLKAKSKKQKIILLSAKGKMFDQKKAGELSKLDQVTLICGHYEGVDERVKKHLIDEEISIGDYVLSGGELAAMVVTDAISRLLPKVLEKEGASEIESFSPGLGKMLSENLKSQISNNQMFLEFPHYTRPEKFLGWKVPEVLLSGNHAEIAKWRTEKIKKK